MAAVSLAVLAASLVLIVGVLHGYFRDQVLEELRQKTTYAALGVEQAGMDYLTGDLPRSSRVTWVAADGTVLFDNWEDPAAMANHADRAEIREALLTGKGSSARYSDTLAEKTLYYALRLSDGSVLRVSDTQDTVWLLVLEAVQPVAFVLLAALVLALWLSGRVARQLVAPINAMDLEDPEGEPPYEELAPLLGRIRSQNRQIRRQMQDLRRRQEEFGAITENMSEGLLVIDRETRVLSYNTAALRLLRGAKPQAGESAYALNREMGFRRCVEGALSGQRTEQLLERDGSCRQVIASPVQQDGAVGGAVLVVLDVTEKEQREQLRREFTANVSHEAQRLIGLVNDIIKLSRLDEGDSGGQWETVELHALAENVLAQLGQAAETKQVTLRLEGGKALARGVPQILEEILYNLCDNAVAYNRPGGSVTVTVEESEQGARVAVADTGVGIPPEARERVFERFYRLDKSHSGTGTGLGLSIVKHGAAYLGAKLSLESQVGVGSTFTVEFPKV